MPLSMTKSFDRQQQERAELSELPELPELPTELFDMILKMKTTMFEQEKKEWVEKRNEFYNASLEIHDIDEVGEDEVITGFDFDDVEGIIVEAAGRRGGWKGFDFEDSVLQGYDELLFDDEKKNVWVNVEDICLITMIDADGERDCVEAYNWCKWVVNDFETITPHGKQNAKTFTETDDE